jgi:anti-anti-sigma factor
MDVFLDGTNDDELLISARGEVDLADAGQLLLRLVVLFGSVTGQVALDLEQVTFMDCAGLRTLDAIEEHVRTRGGRVRVASVSPQIARIFELAGRCGVLPRIAPTRPADRPGAALASGAHVSASNSPRTR